MIIMANLRGSGWGPLPIPGEKARVRRVEMKVEGLLFLQPSIGQDDENSGGAPDSSPMQQVVGPPEQEQSHRPSPTTASRTISHSRIAHQDDQFGRRKIFFKGQAGADVQTLQERLVKFGYFRNNPITGRFDEPTQEALSEFQHDFHIYVDGVAGSVTAKVMRFLESINYDPDKLPISNDDVALIQMVARSQPLGVVLIGNT